MPIESNVLLNEARCLGCGSLSESEMIVAALLQRIAEAGGSGGGGTPSLPLNSVQFNDGGAFGGDADLTWNKTTNLLSITGGIALAGEANETQLAITGYSLTGAASNRMVNLAGVWNTTGNPVALQIAITDTASGPTSKFLEFAGGAGGGTSLFNVDKSGNATGIRFFAGDGAVATPSFAFSSEVGTGIYRVGAQRIGFASGGTLRGEFNGAMLELKAAVSLSFAGATFLRGDDANNEIAQRNGASAQTYKLYRTFTNSTNYERISLGSAAGQMIVAAETAGTGADDLDIVLTSAGLGIVTFTQGIFRHGAGFTVAGLPAAGTVGRRAYVTNALAPAYAAIVAGGGAVIIPVYDDGTNWRVG